MKAKNTLVWATCLLQSAASMATAQPCTSPAFANSCSPCYGEVRGGCSQEVSIVFNSTLGTYDTLNLVPAYACSRAKASLDATGRAVFSTRGDCDCNDNEGGAQFDKDCDTSFYPGLAPNSGATESLDLAVQNVDAVWTFASPEYCMGTGAGAFGPSCNLCAPAFYLEQRGDIDRSIVHTGIASVYRGTILTGSLHCPDGPPSAYSRVSHGSEATQFGATLQRCTSFAPNTVSDGGSLLTLVSVYAVWSRTTSQCNTSSFAPAFLASPFFHKRLRITFSDGSSQYESLHGAIAITSSGNYERLGAYDSSEFTPIEEFDDAGRLVRSTVSGSRYIAIQIEPHSPGVHITSICEAVAPLTSINLDLDSNGRIDACDRRLMYGMIGTQHLPTCEAAENFPVYLDFDGDGFIGPGDAVYFATLFNVASGCNRVDWNCDGVVNPDDIGDFVTYYFDAARTPQDTDFNDDGVLNPDDLGDFITIYFACA